MFSGRNKLYRIPCQCDRPNLPSFIKSNLELEANQEKMSEKRKIGHTQQQQYCISLCGIEIGEKKG